MRYITQITLTIEADNADEAHDVAVDAACNLLDTCNQDGAILQATAGTPIPAPGLRKPGPEYPFRGS